MQRNTRARQKSTSQRYNNNNKIIIHNDQATWQLTASEEYYAVNLFL